MDLPANLSDRLRDRVTTDDMPSQVYALVGASLLVRERVASVPSQARASTAAARSWRDRWSTTAYQVGFEVRDRAVAAPGDLARTVLHGWEQVLGLPGEVRGEVVGRVSDLRDGASGRYSALAASGERALTHWQAQRMLNQRADRLTRAVTPSAARATVTARDAARRTAESPTGVKVKQASGRARQSAKRAWDDYIAAVDEAGSRQWGEPVIDLTAANATGKASAPGRS